jgi:hypothetical protein
VKELEGELNCATNNQWGEWEIERAKIKGENMAQGFRINELTAERDRLREALCGLLDNYKQNKGRGLGMGPMTRARAALAEK